MSKPYNEANMENHWLDCGFRVDAEDLMIGDLVVAICVGEGRFNHYHKVDYETIRRVFLQICNSDYQMVVAPIPLTDAILKRIGFEYYHKNLAALDRESPFQLEMIEWPNESGIGLWMVGGLIKIRFVHELQNAMRMAGIRKYIDIDDIRKDEP